MFRRLLLDADIDNDDNTFFNEYGEFLSLALPVLAPAGAFAPTDWEIGEPEYVYGNIYTQSWDAALDNSNGVPSSARSFSWAAVEEHTSPDTADQPANGKANRIAMAGKVPFRFMCVNAPKVLSSPPAMGGPREEQMHKAGQNRKPKAGIAFARSIYPFRREDSPAPGRKVTIRALSRRPAADREP